jgi:glycosyltransferase involved in cell wall biosynthesis
MRVVFVSPFPPARDGIGTYTQAMMAALQARGHEARVVVPDRLDHLRDEVLLWSPDVVHVQFAVAAFGTRTRTLLSRLRLIRAAAGVPVVVTMHEVTRDTAALRGPGRALYRALAAQCDRVIVHTRSALSALTGAVGVPAAKVTVIPHPEALPPRTVSTAADLRAQFGLGDAELLLAFGFVHVDKGLGDLILALRTIRRAGTPLDNVRLVIAGTVRPRRGLFRVFEWRDRLHLARVLRGARRGGVGDIIVRTGYVREADVAGWFKAASAVVLPYRRVEQSGVASLANAFGVPVLASTAGGLGERYGASGWTFPPRAPRELAAALARFLAAPREERVNATPHAAADMETVIGATLATYGAVTTPAPAAAGSVHAESRHNAP